MRTRAALLLALDALAAPAALGAVGSASGLHDARYCEILELRGGTVTVWNTIGLGKCPAAWWNGLDAGAVARERGDQLVIKNGPRHFLMDSARAETGPVHAFHGERLTKVAEIRIHGAADLEQATYRDRTIDRRNTWTWRSGRRVFELVAPGGDVYVMQSYAQIADPKLTLAQLPRLGLRLHVPDGWRYRSRVLRRSLTLGARGTATIIQDDLQDTYQLETATRKPGPRVRHALAVDGHFKKTDRPVTPGTIEDHGTVTGTPLGRGTLVMVSRLASGRFTGTFRMRFANGSLAGRYDLPFALKDGEVELNGTADIIGGTGALRGATGKALPVHVHDTLDGQNGSLQLSGPVRW